MSGAVITRDPVRVFIFDDSPEAAEVGCRGERLWGEPIIDGEVVRLLNDPLHDDYSFGDVVEVEWNDEVGCLAVVAPFTRGGPFALPESWRRRRAVRIACGAALVVGLVVVYWRPLAALVAWVTS